jgi:para-nitrobenzyl esterase
MEDGMAEQIGETVRVEQGLLHGVRSEDGAVCSYKGVPFARPPVGDLRWRPPQPPDRWDGVRPAESFAAAAIQPPARDHLVGGDGSNAPGPTSEDCLYLNVWTAAKDTEEKRPVMVWLHHGAFLFGSTGVPAYDGENLARAGAVFVSVAYRLGRLGFLAHPELSAESDHGASGHYGLLDQIRGLEWVRENIAAFGGDPDCVTVFGASAGSASVNLLTASPLSRGLFHRGIGESAALMAPTGRTTGYLDQMQDLESAERTGVALARALGSSSVADLRGRTADELIAVPGDQLQPDGQADQNPWMVGGVAWGRGALDSIYPAVDGYVLPRSPHEIYSAGEQMDIPLLVGSNANEGNGMPRIADRDAWEAEARREYGDLADRFLALFSAPDDTLGEVSASVFGDRVFVSQVWTWARLHAGTSGSPVFYYHWSHQPPVRVEPEFEWRARGAFHGAELSYVLANLNMRDWAWEPYDRILMETASSYWLNFARTGNPNGEARPEWSSFDPEAPAAMHFGEEIGMGSVPRPERLAFWDEFYDKLAAADSMTR